VGASRPPPCGSWKRVDRRVICCGRPRHASSAPGAQLIQIGPELDCDLATFGARASNAIIELLKKCGAWPKTGIVQAVYRDSYVSSPLVARLLIDTVVVQTF
jgi:hypothetical protein